MAEVDTLFTMLPTDATKVTSITENFFANPKHTPPLAQQNSPGFNILACNRAAHVAKLKIRPACVEDHDDVVPIFKEQSPIPIMEKDGFFLAKVIESQDAENIALVAERSRRVVGMMVLTSRISTEKLIEEFDLSPFNNLKNDKKQQSAISITMFSLLPQYDPRATDFLKVNLG